MSSPKAEDFTLLLEVFREGLPCGLVSKSEVTNWADGIIINTDEPDYFFIEISLSSCANDLLEVINRYTRKIDDPIVARVLLGLLYKKMHDDKQSLTAEDAAQLIITIPSFWELTLIERNEIYIFDDYDLYYSPELEELHIDIISFLKIYQGFTVENYDQWHIINEGIGNSLEIYAAKQTVTYRVIQQRWEKRQRKSRTVKNIIKTVSILFILTAIILHADWIWHQLTYMVKNTSFLPTITIIAMIRLGVWVKRRK